MIELSESEYKKLQSDANDNNTLKKIVFAILGVIATIALIGWIINPMVTAFMEKWNRDIFIEQAVQNIEKYDISCDEYTKLINVLNSQK